MPSDGDISNRPAALSAVGRGARGALSALDRAIAGVLIGAMAILVSIVSTQVILRYFFNSSLDWAWEASRLAFVSAVFLGIPLALKEHSHVGIDLFQSRLPARGRRILIVGLNMIGVLLMMVVTLVGAQATLSTWDQTLPSIPISSGWFYIPVLWSGLHCSLHFIAQSVDLARGGDLPPNSSEELTITAPE